MVEKYYEEANANHHLQAWVTWQMLRGAGLAAAGVLGVGAILLVVWGVGQLLPEQSKQMPSVYGALDVVQLEEIA